MERYSQEVNRGEPWAEPDPQGCWVLHSEAEAAIAAAVAAERERWIAACDAERAQFAECAAKNDGRQSDFAFGSVNSAERIKAAGLGA